MKIFVAIIAAVFAACLALILFLGQAEKKTAARPSASTPEVVDDLQSDQASKSSGGGGGRIEPLRSTSPGSESAPPNPKGPMRTPGRGFGGGSGSAPRVSSQSGQNSDGQAGSGTVEKDVPISGLDISGLPGTPSNPFGVEEFTGAKFDGGLHALRFTREGPLVPIR